MEVSVVLASSASDNLRFSFRARRFSFRFSLLAFSCSVSSAGSSGVVFSVDSVVVAPSAFSSPSLLRF